MLYRCLFGRQGLWPSLPPSYLLSIHFEVMQEMSSPYGSTSNDITIWEVSAWLLASESNPFPTTCLLKRVSIFIASGGLCCIQWGQVTGLKNNLWTSVSLSPGTLWFYFIFPASSTPGSLKWGRAVAFHPLKAVGLISLGCDAMCLSQKCNHHTCLKMLAFSLWIKQSCLFMFRRESYNFCTEVVIMSAN